MSRKTSFKEQMFRVLNSKNCFGQSKYQAKQESYQNGNNGKVNGIYSKKTMKDYNAKAEAVYEKTVADGSAEAEKITASAKSKTNELAEEIVRWIVSGDC